MATRQQVVRMRERIIDEIYFALGLPRRGILRKISGWLFRLPAGRFARIFAAADEEVCRDGLPAGARSILGDLEIELRAHGAQRLPAEGPLLVISNHPGAYDSAAIASCLPRRDVKIIVGEIAFYHALPNTSQWLFYASNDPARRMLALRQAIRHLQSGGALLQFGSGTIDPDPATSQGAKSALETWHASVELMLRKAPETQTVLCIASGVLLPRFARHPLTRLHRRPVDQRRLAEFMQVIQQLILPRSVQTAPCLSFTPAISVGELEGDGHGSLMEALLDRSRRLLDEHLEACHYSLSIRGR